jgi:hypothetical protein
MKSFSNCLKKNTNSKGLVRALLIGINYIKTEEKFLSGCINDVNNVNKYLLTKYKKSLSSDNIKKLTDDNEKMLPTRVNILNEINWLVKDLKPGQNIFFYYSGHGRQEDESNSEEKSGYNSCIIPIDIEGKYEKDEYDKVKPENKILDDELKKVLADKVPTGCKCFIILDCCNSGTGFDLKYNINVKNVKDINETDNVKSIETDGSVICLSGCRDKESSLNIEKNGKSYGALTNAFLDVLKKNPGKITFENLLIKIRQSIKDEKIQQLPQLSSGKKLNKEDEFNLN